MSHRMTKPINDMCGQRRLRSVWASAQTDQSLRCALNGYLRTQGFLMRTAKTLIRLGGCPGWSESSLGAHGILLLSSCCCSNLAVIPRLSATNPVLENSVCPRCVKSFIDKLIFKFRRLENISQVLLLHLWSTSMKDFLRVHTGTEKWWTDAKYTNIFSKHVCYFTIWIWTKLVSPLFVSIQLLLYLDNYVRWRFRNPYFSHTNA